MSRAFRRWLNSTIDERDRVHSDEHARLLLASNSSHSRREQELLQILQKEKERASIEQEQSNKLSLLGERERFQLLDTMDELRRIISQQEAQLQQLQSQLNTTKSKR